MAWLYRSIRICMLLLITTYNTFGDVMFVANEGNSPIYTSNFELSDTYLFFDAVSGYYGARGYALDYDPYTSTLYFSDHGYNDISTYSVKNNTFSSVSVFIEPLKGVQGIAVDGFGKKLYWTSTAEDRIEVVNLDRSERTVLIDTGLSDPRAIELDLTNRYLYWTDTETRKIERANLDDVNNTRTPLITTGLDMPTGLVLSVADGKMYWCDAGNDHIGEANLDGSNRRIISKLEYDADPYPYDIDILEGYLYGTDNSSRIFRVNTRDGTVTVLSEVTPSNPRGIHIKKEVCSIACQNQGECIIENNVESCHCPYGFTGRTCQKITGYCPCP